MNNKLKHLSNTNRLTKKCISNRLKKKFGIVSDFIEPNFTRLLSELTAVITYTNLEGKWQQTN